MYHQTMGIHFSESIACLQNARYNIESVARAGVATFLHIASQASIWKANSVGELPIWDRDASILASRWSSGDHCSTLAGTGSKHK